MHHLDVSIFSPKRTEPKRQLMLELAILGLLGEQELHGYEIRKRLRDELGLFANVSFGSLYPALSRLERAGDVETVEEPVGREKLAVSVPMTGSLSGERAAMRVTRSPAALGRRGKKVYRITEQGRRQFGVLLDADPASEDARGFGLRLAFARYLPPQARLRLLERRRAHLADRLADARATVSSGEDRLDTYTRSLVDHITDTTERDISWLDRLIELERSRNTIETDTPNQVGAATAFPHGEAIRTGEPI